MASTRNKNRKDEFFIDKKMQERQVAWQTTTESVQKAAYPCHGINVQRMPAEKLSNNSVDVETYLYGIGANNHLFPTSTPTNSQIKLPSTTFYNRPAVYIPKLPDMLTNQRPF
jgi:hypothetical protein